MAKATAATNKIVPISDALTPAFLADRIKADAGKGVSSSQADNIVPLIYILQALSPQVNPAIRITSKAPPPAIFTSAVRLRHSSRAMKD
jgi:hypothetical protein